MHYSNRFHPRPGCTGITDAGVLRGCHGNEWPSPMLHATALAMLPSAHGYTGCDLLMPTQPLTQRLHAAGRERDRSYVAGRVDLRRITFSSHEVFAFRATILSTRYRRIDPTDQCLTKRLHVRVAIRLYRML